MPTRRISDKRRLSIPGHASINSHGNESGYALFEDSSFYSREITPAEIRVKISRVPENKQHKYIIIESSAVSCRAKAVMIDHKRHKYVKLQDFDFVKPSSIKANVVCEEILSFVGPGIRNAEEGRLKKALSEAKGHPVAVEVDASLKFTFDKKYNRIVAKPTYLRNWRLIDNECR